jgi:hypothetical protein
MNNLFAEQQKKDTFDDIRKLAFVKARDLGGDIGDTFSHMEGVPSGVIALAIGTAFAELAGSLGAMVEMNSNTDDDTELRDYLNMIVSKSYDIALTKIRELDTGITEEETI